MTKDGTTHRGLDWVSVVQRLRTIAGEGLAYSEEPYDLDRYRRLDALAREITAASAGLEAGDLETVLVDEGYPTPKVDVRAAVFDGSRVLLVREASDGRWSLPGGWADLGDTPGQVAAREVAEEAGYLVRPVRLLALYDKARHQPGRSLQSVYKVFIDCELSQPEPVPPLTAHEVTAVDWFEVGRPPALSTSRVTEAQLARMWELHQDGSLPADFD